MAETGIPVASGARRRAATLARIAAWAVVGGLALVVAAELAFFTLHAAQMLGYPYPLDYGEGPLLAQVNLLLSGTPLWRIYADPGQPPYAVVNYPPVYHLLTTLLAWLLDTLGIGGPLGTGGDLQGAALLAGRLVSLAATLAATLALWLLARGRRLVGDRRQETGGRRQPTTDHRPSIPDPRPLNPEPRPLAATLVVLAFLGLPIVREWGALMRVDMLGLCLGLWGLVIVQRGVGRRALLWAALPLTLSLFVKPSLIAAPAAALLWLLLRDWRRALQLGALMAAGGGLAFGLLHIASGGWFTMHILAANVNAWDSTLARGFWREQLGILWPLLAAAGLALVGAARPPTTDHRRQTTDDEKQETRDKRQESIGDEGSTQYQARFTFYVLRFTPLLPLFYTLFGAIVALGVGKVGAYANYFLEFYAGLIWLAALATTGVRSQESGVRSQESGASWFRGSAVLGSAVLVPLLVVGALLRFYPLWSETYLAPYGMIEQSRPPRIAFGRYGVWQDLARERQVLRALGHINAALVGEVRAAGAPIVTDIPGVAAQAGQLTRIQAFEHRQLLDAGLWDQRPLLRDLANGRVPLIALDYLGNWLTPEMIALITHRYGQTGSRGTYDLYLPVEVGPLAAADLAFVDGPRLVGYRLRLPAGSSIYQAGETVLLTLEWRRAPAAQQAPAGEYEVIAQLLDDQGQVLLERARPLLYGALSPADWGDAVMQHLQPIALPLNLPDGTYRLAVTLRAGGRDLAAPHTLAPIVVAEQSGRLLGEQGYFVPEPLLLAWLAAGSYEDAGPGDPVMPAVQFHDSTLQCFARACLRIQGNTVQRLPLGELVALGDGGNSAVAPATEGGDEQFFAETGQRLRGPFLDYWRANGGRAAFGPPIGGEMLRGDRIIQYTRYARLERPIEGGEVRLGRLGEDFLQLPGGVPYRWP